MQNSAGALIGGAVAIVMSLPLIFVLMITLAFGGVVGGAVGSVVGVAANACAEQSQNGPGGPLPPGDGKGTVQPVDDIHKTSGFGPRWGQPHNGIDMPSGGEGSPIYAFADGKVVKAGAASGFGQWIVIDHNLGGKRVSTVYGHMYPKDLGVKEGDKVKAGQGIARVGSNGHSTGPHLHFEYWPGGRFGGGKPIDPTQYVKAARPAKEAHKQAAAPMRQAYERYSDDNSGDDGKSGDDKGGDDPVGGFPLPKPDGKGEQGGKAGAIPENALAAYKKAGKDYQIPWVLLAGIGWAETKHGTSNAPGVKSGENSAGAKGPMQFLQGTWDGYAADGNGDGRKNVYDIADAAAGAAKYLIASGLKKNGEKGVWDAIYAYNHLHAYGNDVLSYAWQYADGKVPTVPGEGSGQCEPGGGGASSGGDNSHGKKGADPKDLKTDWPQESQSVDDPTTNGKIRPRMKAVYDAVEQGKAGSKPASTGCFRPHDAFHDHPDGYACDFMYTPANTDKNVNNGWVLANWAVAHQKEFGIEYVIWQGKIWSSTREPEHWRPYTVSGCPQPSKVRVCHYDHVHISVFK